MVRCRTGDREVPGSNPVQGSFSAFCDFLSGYFDKKDENKRINRETLFVFLTDYFILDEVYFCALNYIF